MWQSDEETWSRQSTSAAECSCNTAGPQQVKSSWLPSDSILDGRLGLGVFFKTGKKLHSRKSPRGETAA